jgi:hypothetical protein
LISGAVATSLPTSTPLPSGALPSTGLPLTWVVAVIALVLIAVGARYVRQSST